MAQWGGTPASLFTVGRGRTALYVVVNRPARAGTAGRQAYKPDATPFEGPLLVQLQIDAAQGEIG